MYNTGFARTAAAIGLLFLGAQTLPAAMIPTLFNTGVDAAGALLLGGDGITDTHYTLTSGPGIGAPASAVTYKHPAYLADGASSRWLSSTASGGPSAGTYVFRTTFDLTGFSTAATSISVSCATDNSFTSLALNGVVVAGDCDGFGAFSPAFLVSSGFVAGVNTFDFTVVDDGSPMGFRAQYVSDTTALTGGSVPEPATMALMGLGLALIAVRQRARS